MKPQKFKQFPIVTRAVMFFGLAMLASSCGTFINPPPTPISGAALSISTLAPSLALGGSSSQTVLINGTGFSSTSVVSFNGTVRPFTLVSSQQISFTLSQADLATPGNYAVSISTQAGVAGATATSTFSVWNPVSEPTTGIIVGYPPDWADSIFSPANGQPAEVGFTPSGSQPDASNEYVADIIEDFISNPSSVDLNSFYSTVADINLFQNSQSYVNLQINGLNAVKFTGVYGMIPTDVIAIQKGNTVIEISDVGQRHETDGILDEFAAVVK